MGQQQLLLIILGVIVVGVAIVVGVNLFTASAVEAKRDNVISDLIHLASDAQKYYRIPKTMGGGAYQFTGWEIPKQLRTNADGSFSATVSADNVILIGTGNAVVTGNDSVKVKMTVTADDYDTEIIH
jgi:Tfp pilus assembly protein PilE